MAGKWDRGQGDLCLPQDGIDQGEKEENNHKPEIPEGEGTQIPRGDDRTMQVKISKRGTGRNIEKIG